MNKLKRLITLIIIIISTTLTINATDKFMIISSGIKDGVIDSKYGINGEFVKNGIPFLSLPIDIHNPPKGSKSYAITILDYDAIEPTGFIWIHWSVANIKGLSVKENASREDSKLVQGVNSWYSQLIKNPLTKEQASFYGGMVPPDKEHTYTITCYALDTVLDIKNGFFLNELYEKMEGHVIDKVSITGKYPKQIENK